MTEKSILTDLITGLEASLKDLQGKKDLFIRAKGIHEEEEKLRAEGNKIRTEITDAKATVKDLVEKKNAAMKTVTAAMAKTMNAVLPAGSSVIEIMEDGTFSIGWNNGKATVPYSGLSGGEKASFDPALCRALGGSILVVEAAEIDGPHLTDALRKYEAAGMQVIVNTCHQPEVVPLEWKAVAL
jgi:hypothetical protein